MTLHELLLRLRAEVPGCVAALAMSSAKGVIDTHGDPVDASVATVLCELFDRNRALAAAAGNDTAPREMVVMSGERTYICHALDGEDALVAAVCSGISNVGLLLTTTRREIAAMEGRA